MPLPQINDLPPVPEPERDEVTILSRSEKRKKKRKPAIQVLHEDELVRFFNAIDSVRDRAIFRLMYHAGLRASEVGMLDMRDYDPRTDRIMIHRLKGSSSGQHHLSRIESRALRAWLKERGNGPGTIFRSRKHGPISRKRLDALVKVYAAKAGLPTTLRHCHMFKHACCTHLLTKGFHVEQVQDWVGHRNIQNTMIYAQVTNSRRDEMARMLREWQ